MPTYLTLPKQVQKNKCDIEELQNSIPTPGQFIPITEKGSPLGVATLDATGKVPAAQIPVNPGNFLPITGGTLLGDIDMDGGFITSAHLVDSAIVFTQEIDSTDNEIDVQVPLNMKNNKLTNVAKGSSTKDVATIENINDHNTSPFAHADIRNLITAIQGTYVYVGKIFLDTKDVTDTTLNLRVNAILSRSPLNGDVLVDNDNGEWRFDGTNWVNLGHFDIALASAFNDGLMTKEDYTKLNDLLNKSDFDSLIATLATMDYLVNNYYNKAMIDAKELSLQGDIVSRELLANKATDFSTVNDTKYPTTKAVNDRFEIKLLDQPSEIFGGQSFNQWFNNNQSVVNGDFSNGTTGWSPSVATNMKVTNGIMEWTNTTATNNGIQRPLTFANAKYYTIARVFAPGVYIFRSYTRATDFQNLIASANTVAGWNIISAINPINTSDNFIFAGFAAAEGITFKLDYIYTFNISTLITNKQYSPLYNTTFDLMSDEQIKIQMDEFVRMFQLFKDSSITSIVQELSNKANKKQEAWITPTLLNGWTHIADSPIQYRLNSMGRVEFRGGLNNESGQTNVRAFTLPVGYRPTQAVYYNQGGSLFSSIDTAGGFRNTHTTGFTAYDGFSFSID